MTCTVVHESTISRLFKESFSYSATLCKPNIIPFGRLRPENQWRAAEYFKIIAAYDPYRIKFGDEKHLKGREVFNRRNRRNPFTGEVPPSVGIPDLTNTYSLTGFCSIDRRSSPVFAIIHDAMNGAKKFQLQLSWPWSAGGFTLEMFLSLITLPFIMAARTLFFKTGCGRSLALLFSFFLRDLLS